MAQWILHWNEAAVSGAEVYGGKGWNLGRLARYGFPVPAGGVVVADLYRRLTTLPAIRPLIADLAGVGPEEVLRPEVEQALARVREAITAADLPAEAAEAIAAFLSRHGLDRVPVAVRSSATAEDSAAASFAGIHRSFLGVRGTEAVLAALKGCYASLWTPRALAYRRRLGLSDQEVACAGVICAMVTGPGGGPPVAAGVAFSCDPRTGRRDQVTISAAPGLGEAVVGGQVSPEEITVTHVGTEFRVSRGPGNPAPVLSDDQALQLARLTWRVQWALGDGQDPQDMEWAYDGERFWVLQARPVTRLPRVTYPEVARLPVIWSNGNLKDAVAGVQSTLSWSQIQVGLRHILWAPLTAIGADPPPGAETVRRFAGRAYFDLTTLMWAMYDVLGVTPRDFNRVLGGHQPEIPVPPGSPFRGRRGLRRVLHQVRLARLLLRLRREFPAEVAAALAAARELAGTDLTAMTEAELLDFTHRLVARQVAFGPRFQLANIAAGAWNQALERLAERIAPGQGPTLAARLMAGSGAVTSAEHGYRLRDLAAAARRDPAALAYLSAGPLNPEGWRHLPPGSPFRQELERFLADFGHRGVYEVDVANPRWQEDPTYLLEQVRLWLAAGDGPDPREGARAARAAAEAEVARRAGWLRPLVFWLAEQARQAAALREAGKSALVALLWPVRRLALEVGRRLTAAGALDSPGDVFHLAWVELDAYLRGEWDGAGARALVADRRARDARWLAEEPPDVFILDAAGRPATLAEAAAPALRAGAEPALAGRQAGGTVLRGLGVAAGRARGRARVIRHPGEGGRLQPGEVLVAPSTDPGWTPLFLRAAAVVVEVGGYLSHGAIVAREYGLPAVVNIPGLLSAVRDGQMLTVDGDCGEVRVEG